MRPSPRHVLSRSLLLVLLLAAPLLTEAHALNTDLSRLSRADVVLTYLKLGFTHILPLGLDHILFVVGLFVLEPRLRPVLWQATAFTLAHSITLGLAAAGIVTPLPTVVEPLISLSILFVAVENLLTNRLQPWRVALVFGFGLLHGLGFAGALADIGLPKHAFVEALISFNVGVELGQVAVIMLAWLLLGKWFSHKIWYKQRVVVPVSLLIAAVALWWTVERVFMVG